MGRKKLCVEPIEPVKEVMEVKEEAGSNMDGAGKKRKLSAYNIFVKEHIKSMTGATQREKMSQVAKLWKERK